MLSFVLQVAVGNAHLDVTVAKFGSTQSDQHRNGHLHYSLGLGTELAVVGRSADKQLEEPIGILLKEQLGIIDVENMK
jgi:hypothetical protein